MRSYGGEPSQRAGDGAISVSARQSSSVFKSLRAHMNGEYFLTLDGGHELKLSRTYRDKVEYFLNASGLN